MSFYRLKKCCFEFYHKCRRIGIKRLWRKRYKARLRNTARLTAEHKIRLKEFYAPYAKVSPVFHQVYYESTGNFSEKYLPADLYFNVIDEYFNDRSEAKYLDNKCYYKKLFPGIRQPEYAIARVGKYWFDENDNVISYEKVKEIISKESELFIKVATDSCGGSGVSYISREKGDMVNQFEKFECKTDFIAQRALHQHKDMSAINESSVNTIRVISFLTEDEVKIYSSIVRAGQKGSKCDNSTGGGVSIGIDDNGNLKKYGYEISGKRYDRHPTNDFVFEGHPIPSFNKVTELVKKVHPMVSHFRLVSWDICIAEDGEPVLLEANLCRGSLDVHQYNNGPLFGEDTKKILDEVFGKNK